MIEFLKIWAKGLGLSIVIVSILEMLLPNNKTKKYIRMVMGIYILFSIISPLVKNKEIFSYSEGEFENITNNIDSSNVNQNVNQKSMDRRIEELYSLELEKDIIKKLKSKGFSISKCKVNASIGEKEEKTKISKIKIIIDGKVENQKSENSENEIIENIIVEEIQKVRVAMGQDEESKEISKEISKEDKNEKEVSISKEDIQNIKKFLIDEYGVSEGCLEIN